MNSNWGLKTERELFKYIVDTRPELYAKHNVDIPNGEIDALVKYRVFVCGPNDDSQTTIEYHTDIYEAKTNRHEKSVRKARSQLLKARKHIKGKGINYLYTHSDGLEELVLN